MTSIPSDSSMPVRDSWSRFSKGVQPCRPFTHKVAKFVTKRMTPNTVRNSRIIEIPIGYHNRHNKGHQGCYKGYNQRYNKWVAQRLMKGPTTITLTSLTGLYLSCTLSQALQSHPLHYVRRLCIHPVYKPISIQGYDSAAVINNDMNRVNDKVIPLLPIISTRNGKVLRKTTIRWYSDR